MKDDDNRKQQLAKDIEKENQNRNSARRNDDSDKNAAAIAAYRSQRQKSPNPGNLFLLIFSVFYLYISPPNFRKISTAERSTTPSNLQRKKKTRK